MTNSNAEFVPEDMEDLFGTPESGNQEPEAAPETNKQVVPPVPPVESDDEIVSRSTRSEICEPGAHDAVCVAVEKVGLQTGYMGGPNRRKAVIMYELADKITSGPLEGEPYRLSTIVTAELYEKSGLVKLLKSWFGKDPIQRNGGESRLKLSSLIGKPAIVVVKHDEKDGKTVARIASVLPAAKNAPVIKPTYNPQNVPDFILKMRAQQLPDPRKS